MTKAKTIEDHTPLHEEVLVACAGEKLRVVREDEQWPGWLWCVADSGTGSWVPEPYLERDGEQAWLLVDYDATELSVRPGHMLTLHHEVNGWWWTTDANGRQGWVPAAKLKRA